MTNPSKQKGTAAETAVAAWLMEQGRPNIERRAQHGNTDRGDIAGIPGVVIEVKACKTFDLAGWTKELEAEIENDRADVGAIIAKKRGTSYVGDWYAIMPAWVFEQLLEESGR